MCCFGELTSWLIDGDNATLRPRGSSKRSRVGTLEQEAICDDINVWNKLSTDCVHATSVNVL